MNKLLVVVVLLEVILQTKGTPVATHQGTDTDIATELAALKKKIDDMSTKLHTKESSHVSVHVHDHDRDDGHSGSHEAHKGHEGSHVHVHMHIENPHHDHYEHHDNHHDDHHNHHDDHHEHHDNHHDDHHEHHDNHHDDHHDHHDHHQDEHHDSHHEHHHEHHDNHHDEHHDDEHHGHHDSHHEHHDEDEHGDKKCCCMKKRTKEHTKHMNASVYHYARCNVAMNPTLEKSPHTVEGSIFFRQKMSDPLEVVFNLTGFNVPHGAHANHPLHMHAIHVHQFSDFSNGCQSYGGHYNPDGVDHGGHDSSTRHAGDWGNIACDAQGEVHSNMTDSNTSLVGAHSIMGRGIVIHEHPDDLGQGDVEASLKTGNAGGRLACCTVVWSQKLDWDTLMKHGH